MNNVLSQTIEEFNKTHRTTLNNPTFDIFKNDLGYDRVIYRLSNLTNSPENNTVGIMIGMGAAYSVLPNLPCDNVLICDYNLFVLDTAKYIKNLIKSCETLQSFKKMNETNPYYMQVVKKYGTDSFKEFKRISEGTLGELSYEYSEGRFSLCREVLRDDKDVFFVQINLNDSRSINELGEILTSLKIGISFIDFSNVGDYIFKRDLFKSDLNRLPFSKNGSFVYSTRIGDELPQSVGPTNSLTSYLGSLA